MHKTAAYTNVRLGFFGRVSEFLSLVKLHRRRGGKAVQFALAEVKSAIGEIEQIGGFPCRERSILEVGSGQESMQLAYFSLQNNAQGIDSEFTAQRGLQAFYNTVKSDGWVRAVKTSVRRLSGFDKRRRKAFVAATGAKEWPAINVLKMDAASMEFEDGRFDVVYSRAVFEHLSDPRAVVREARRVLRPGGVFYCLLHLYTSDSGCHDIRIFSNRRESLPLWPHLDPETKPLVLENTYLNRLRLGEWKDIFESELPGSQVTPMLDDSGRANVLDEMRKQGKFQGYADEELLSVTLKTTWLKPE